MADHFILGGLDPGTIYGQARAVVIAVAILVLVHAVPAVHRFDGRLELRVALHSAAKVAREEARIGHGEVRAAGGAPDLPVNLVQVLAGQLAFLLDQHAPEPGPTRLAVARRVPIGRIGGALVVPGVEIALLRVHHHREVLDKPLPFIFAGARCRQARIDALRPDRQHADMHDRDISVAAGVVDVRVAGELRCRALIILEGLGTVHCKPAGGPAKLVVRHRILYRVGDIFLVLAVDHGTVDRRLDLERNGLRPPHADDFLPHRHVAPGAVEIILARIRRIEFLGVDVDDISFARCRAPGEGVGASLDDRAHRRENVTGRLEAAAREMKIGTIRRRLQDHRVAARRLIGADQDDPARAAPRWTAGGGIELFEGKFALQHSQARLARLIGLDLGGRENRHGVGILKGQHVVEDLLRIRLAMFGDEILVEREIRQFAATTAGAVIFEDHPHHLEELEHRPFGRFDAPFLELVGQ